MCKLVSLSHRLFSPLLDQQKPNECKVAKVASSQSAEPAENSEG